MIAQTIGNVVLVAAAIPAVLFVGFYATRSRWEVSQIGRQTMALSVVIALVLSLSVIRILFGDAEWYAIVRALVFATIVPVLWWRLVLLLQAQGYTGNATHVKEERSMIPDENPSEPLFDHEPVDVQETDLPPTGTPPESWDQEAHVDAYAADPAVSTYADEED